jgi:hypothetical protein
MYWADRQLIWDAVQYSSLSSVQDIVRQNGPVVVSKQLPQALESGKEVIFNMKPRGLLASANVTETVVDGLDRLSSQNPG